MKSLCCCLALVAGLASVSLVYGQEPVKPSTVSARMGINLAGPADWNTELPLVNVFNLSREWISQREGEGWGKGPRLELDARGWVRRLESGCYVESPLCTIEGGHYPSGEYVIEYEGKGKLELWGGGAQRVKQEPGREVWKLEAAKGGFFLRIQTTDPENYVRNIRVWMPGFDTVGKSNPWHPDFLARWQGMAGLRFMDLMNTNNSTLASWAERPEVGDATYCSGGLPLELLIDLANRLDSDPWFCMPHRADDDFVRQFARVVKEKLEPQRKVYIEYSNEVWNGQFQQNKYAGDEGLRLKMGEKHWEAAWHYTAVRSVQIFKIWEEVFGGHERLIRVLPSQSANPYVGRQILTWQDAYKQADALAIAPYVGFSIAPDHKEPVFDTIVKWSPEQLLEHIEKQVLPECDRQIRDNKKLADEFGLQLIAYEAGQHLVGIGGGENNEQLTALFHQANAHPRLGQIYNQYYQIWQEAGGGLMCHFSSVGNWSKWGSWGLLQYYDDKPEASPKFQSTMQWMKRWK